MFLTNDVIVLLHIAALLGWCVERLTNFRGEDILRFMHQDIELWGLVDGSCGAAPACLCIEVPVSAQNELVEIVRKAANIFDINKYVDFCVGWKLAWRKGYKKYDFAGMKHDAERIRDVMQSFCAELRRLKSNPEFLRAPDAMARTLLLEDAAKKFGAYLRYDKGEICCDTESFPCCRLSYYDLEGKSEEIDSIIEELECVLGHYEDWFKELLERYFDFGHDVFEVISEAHAVKEALEKLAVNFEREDLEATLAG